MATTVVAVFAAVVTQLGYGGLLLFLTVAWLVQLGLAVNRRSRHWLYSSLLTLLGLILMFLALFLGIVGSVAVWSGHKDIPLTIVLEDADGTTPVEGAVVKIGEVDERWNGTPPIAIDSKRRLVSRTTDSNGKAVLTYTFPCGGRDTSGHVYFAWAVLEVSAPGHKPIGILLSNLTGRARDIDSPIPPPMHIQLERE